MLAAICSHFSPPPVSPLGQRGRPCACDHRWNITWSVCVCVSVYRGGGYVHGLTSSFILFFPPLLPPERRVRPKCMAQRYCLLGTHTRDRPVPPGWALGAQHSPLGGGGVCSPRATPRPGPVSAQAPEPGACRAHLGSISGGRIGITPTLCPPTSCIPQPGPVRAGQGGQEEAASGEHGAGRRWGGGAQCFAFLPPLPA